MSFHSALVVDDSKLARITLQRLLQKHNLSVDVAESGIAALEKLKSNKPDIIFMDHLMPELDGFEATQKIKADPATNHIPVIMCTGKEDTDNYDEQARGIGASGTLSKPPQADQLALILAAAQTGERLVVAAPGLVDSGSGAADAAITEISFAARHTADNTEIAQIFERLNLLEQSSKDQPAMDALLERFATAETSLTTLQESVISLQNATSEAQPSVDEISGSVQERLQSHFQEQFTALQNKEIDIDALKSELSEVVEARLAKHMEEISQVSAEPAAFDEEALAARLAGDIENTLISLFADDLQALEQKLAAATDDAISESRKDLDEHLQESVSKLEFNSNAAGEADLPGLLDKIRGDVADIATQSANAALDTSFDDRLQKFTALTQSSAADAGGNGKDAGGNGKVAIDSIVNDPQFIALVTDTVEAQMLVQTSAINDDAPSYAAEPQSSAAGSMVHQQIEGILERVGELDRRQEALMDRLDAMKNQQQGSPQGDNKSGGLVLGVIALAGAALAMAKAFGLF